MDLVAVIANESARIADVLADVDGNAHVPTCTGWTALDLAWHLAEGQTFWATMVEGRRAEPLEPDDNHPDDFTSSLTALRDASTRLIEVLEATPHDAPVWSWSANGGTAAWVQRRMAHEALVHRLDAEATAGVSSPVDEQLALDGIDELITEFLTGVPDWGDFTPSGDQVTIAPDGTARTWSLALGRFTGTSPVSGSSQNLAAALLVSDPEPENVVSGAVREIHAWLWGRGDIGAIRFNGAAAAAERLRALALDATQ